MSAAISGRKQCMIGMSLLETESLFFQQFQLEQRLEELRQKMISLFGGQQCYLQNMNTNVQRIAIQPRVQSSLQQRGRVVVGTHGSQVTFNEETKASLTRSRTGSSVKLYKSPKILYALQKEREFGLKGVMAVKDFTRLERGTNRFSYCRHEVF